MRPLLRTLLLASAASLCATPAFAFPHLTTTACDTLGTDPLRVRTTFTLDLVGPGWWCWFDVSPRSTHNDPTDTTQFFDCGAPAGWGCDFGGGLYITFAQPGDPLVCFGAGEHFGGFWIVSDRPGPCAWICFENGILGGDYNTLCGEGCLVLDGPVPARPASWGRLKSIYRD